MKTRAALASVLLSLLFVIVYTTTNWIASERDDVGRWYFEWELAIPLVPLMIIPYMSIDLFFVVAPFLCRDKHELKTFALRISFSIVVAGTCFLLFPLELVFDRQPVEGWLGVIFNGFLALDKPYNLLPSLHIALWTILADLYARKTRGVTNASVHVWFSLIGLSTLLTHQHHLVDVIGGFVLAALTMYLFRPSTHRLPVTRNLRVGSYYGLLAVAMAILSLATWRSGVVLLWPTISLAIIAGAYAGLGPGVYRKSEGRLPLSARFLLGPILLGQYLSLLYYRRQCRPWDEVTQHVLIGRQLDDGLAGEAIDAGVTAVLDVTAEFSEAEPFLAIEYRNLPILDLTAPTQDQLCEAVGFITEHAAEGVVYVHCKIGYSRSAAAVAAYLLASGQAASVEEAIEKLRSVRPAIVVRTEVREALRRFASRREDGK